MDDARQAWELCRECAESVASGGDATAVALLLYRTAAHESAGFVFRRQTTPRWDGSVGAFSLWQLEQASIEAGMAMLAKPGPLQERAARFLFGADWHRAILGGWPRRWDTHFVVEALRSRLGDRLGVLLCRLHYLRCPGAIPVTLRDQAAYWKKWYNTERGKGTVEEWITHAEQWDPKRGGGEG